MTTMETSIKIATFTPHHHSGMRPYKKIVSGRVEAIACVLSEIGGGLEAAAGDVEKAIETAKEKGQSILEAPDGEIRKFQVWYKQDGEKVNFGISEIGDDGEVDSMSSVRISIAKFAPDQKELNELASRPPMELASMLLLDKELRSN